MQIKNFESVVAWQKAYKFTLMVYRIANTFPSANASGSALSLKEPQFLFRLTLLKDTKNLAKPINCVFITSRRAA